MGDARKRLADRLKSVIRRSRLYRVVEYLRNRREFRHWERTGRKGPAPHLVKQAVVREYALKYGLTTLIETGTYRGAMVSAMKNHFNRIISIELDPTLAGLASRRFSNSKHVTIVQGDSSEILPAVLVDVDAPSLFWLDGHYSGGITARGALQTPVVKELETILDQFKPNDVILIDDARHFTGQNDYPTVEDVERVVHQRHSEYKVEVKHDIIRIHPRGISSPIES